MNLRNLYDDSIKGSFILDDAPLAGYLQQISPPDAVQEGLLLLQADPGYESLVHLLLRRVLDSLDKPSSITDRVYHILHSALHRDHSDHVKLFLIGLLQETGNLPQVSQMIDMAMMPGLSAAVRTKLYSLFGQVQGTPYDLQRMLKTVSAGAADEEVFAAFLALCKSGADLIEAERGIREEILKEVRKIVSGSGYSKELRQSGLALMGRIGNPDLLEELIVIMPDIGNFAAEIGRMVEMMVKRPINIFSLRPEIFEHLIADLLVRIGYRDVQRTRTASDGGFDVLAYREPNSTLESRSRKVLIECKRFRDRRIDPGIIARLSTARDAEEADEAVVITTGGITEEARKSARSSGIDCVDGIELAGILNAAYGPGRYVLAP